MSIDTRKRPAPRRPLRKLFPAVVVGAIILSGCDPSDLFSWTFTVDQDLGEQTVPGDPVLAGTPLNLSIPIDVPDLSTEQAYQNEIFDFVQGVSVADITLSITATSVFPDFSFIESASVWLDSVGGSVPSQQIAFIDPGDPQLQPGVTTLQIATTGVDLTDIIINAGQYRVRIEVQGTVPPSDVSFDGTVSIDVTVGLF